ncbi:MAG: S4 domain-containing protein YaaA [Romboutsia sp.]|jgi:ribosome-associated protein|nr:S4 domain-containing protein YaaA [Romboutsia sp.]MBP3906097.1 S4 domain-containing protein YaaA [Peptostreptococcaceae bacterium]MBP3929005.1 S4 domain-containing protein YaaA [Peptostreptococcaceae bacterium]MBQ1793986.1 S4 domain-containing protein YaaA [Peptostreptococcaceae bacterium]
MFEITIDSEYIKLDQFLKLVDVASTGGHAKFLIQEGLVKVNGEVETRRGKKLRSNDVVEVEGNKIKIL